LVNCPTTLQKKEVTIHLYLWWHPCWQDTSSHDCKCQPWRPTQATSLMYLELCWKRWPYDPFCFSLFNFNIYDQTELTHLNLEKVCHEPIPFVFLR
jgi:hypothetical protein